MKGVCLKTNRFALQHFGLCRGARACSSSALNARPRDPQKKRNTPLGTLFVFQVYCLLFLLHKLSDRGQGSEEGLFGAAGDVVSITQSSVSFILRVGLQPTFRVGLPTPVNPVKKLHRRHAQRPVSGDSRSCQSGNQS